MRYYIIDGNNLIHKIDSLKNLQSKDKFAVREKLAFMVDRFFAGKNVKCVIVFDGFKTDAIKTSKTRIFYSENLPADNLIKEKIEMYKNPRNITVISSDHEIMNFAKKCSCEVKLSEEFSTEMQSKNDADEEEQRIKSLSNDEMKRIFGVD